MWTCPSCKEQIEDQFDSCWRCAGTTQPLPAAAAKCFRCGGTQLVKGKLEITGSSGRLTDLVFNPGKIRFLALTLSHGTPVDKESYACLGCGCVWSEINPEALREFIKKHCKES